MQSPEIPEDEDFRLETLRNLHVLDTDPEERFDRLTRLAQNFFAVPIAVVSLIDQRRQWFKSIQGLDVKETSREVSFCGHAILKQDLMIVPDALDDTRFADNPLVTTAPHIRFYAGCPLVAKNGAKLGTLCLIDQEPRLLTAQDQKLLQSLGRLAQQELALMQTSTIDEVTLLSNLSGFQMLAEPTLELAESLEIKATLLLFCLKSAESHPEHLNVTHSQDDLQKNQCKAFARHLLTHFQIADIIARVSENCFAALLTHADEETIEKAIAALKNSTLPKNQLQGSAPDHLQFETQKMTLAPSAQTLEETIKSMIENFSTKPY
mgnify:CR=1 FL=1